MFAPEKPQVYGKALDFGAKAAAWATAWHKKHGSAPGWQDSNLTDKVEDKVRAEPKCYSIPLGKMSKLQKEDVLQPEGGIKAAPREAQT